MKQNFIHSLMDANSDNEISSIISENIELLFSNPELWKYVRNSKRRIRRINNKWRFKKNCWNYCYI